MTKTVIYLYEIAVTKVLIRFCLAADELSFYD